MSPADYPPPENQPVSIGPNGLNRPVSAIAAHSAFWSSSALVVTMVAQLAGFGILGRLLNPRDFGLVGMALTVISLFDGLANLGLSIAIIQRKEVTEDQLHSLYWANVLSGLLTAAIVLALTPLAAWYFKEPKVLTVLAILSLMFVVQVPGQQFAALLRKNLEFRLLAVADIAGALASLAFGVVLALMHAGYYALIAQQLGRFVIRTVVLCWVGFRRWRPRAHFSWSDLRGYLSFGLYQTGDRMINMLAANMDYLVIGRFLGVKALGFYTIAYQLTTLPLNKINPVLTQFALPVMSLFQDENDRVTNVYQRTMQLIALVTFPLLVGLGLMAAPAVRVIFGPQWDDSVRLVQALTIMGIGKSLIGVGGSVFMSKGRADLGFWQSVIVAVVSAVVFYFTVQVGVPTLAWSYSALMVVQFAALLLVMKWLVGFRFGPFFRLMALPLAASAVMAAALVAAERALSFTSAASWPAVAQLAVLVTIGAVAYVGVLLALDRKLVATAVVAFFKRGEAR